MAPSPPTLDGSGRLDVDTVSHGHDRDKHRSRPHHLDRPCLPTAEGDGLGYHVGFGNHHESECVPGTLPRGRNNPRLVPGRLYAEQLSGTAFTSPRDVNRRTWLYRIRPSALGTASGFRRAGGGGTEEEGAGTAVGMGTGSVTGEGERAKKMRLELPRHFGRCDWKTLTLDPDPMRWGPTPLPSEERLASSSSASSSSSSPSVNFVQGARTMMGSGDPTTRDGVAIYVFSINADMTATAMTGTPENGTNDGDADARDDDNDNHIPKMDCHMYNSDGDFLIVPQHGSLDITTELGRMIVHPKEICVLPRGVVFSVNIYRPDADQRRRRRRRQQQQHQQQQQQQRREGLGGDMTNGNGEHRREHDDDDDDDDDEEKEARGYMLEIFKGHFSLPELGPIGSNGLANARDFLCPAARYESDPSIARRCCLITNKFGNELFVRTSDHSPYDVVSWHGNYCPYKYDLTRFCAVNSVTYDHLDPSIYTVLTARSDETGTALADFVIFPPRIMATDEDTFRPPWFHRNVMSEFMGLIYGEYDAKQKQQQQQKVEDEKEKDDASAKKKKKKNGGGGRGFQPGGASLHNTMTPHGPDAASYRKAVNDPCDAPRKFDGGLAFMFETGLTLKCSEYALRGGHREREYANCWDGLDDEFSEWLKEKERAAAAEDEAVAVMVTEEEKAMGGGREKARRQDVAKGDGRGGGEELSSKRAKVGT